MTNSVTMSGRALPVKETLDPEYWLLQQASVPMMKNKPKSRFLQEVLIC